MGVVPEPLRGMAHTVRPYGGVRKSGGGAWSEDHLIRPSVRTGAPSPRGEGFDAVQYRGYGATPVVRCKGRFAEWRTLCAAADGRIPARTVVSYCLLPVAYCLKPVA